ncbi:MAG: hypothetical protein C5B55_12825 [Blastocatellia bacterium]|nr:MAG: hypothetical protein C5B55_12825 [Blastocatellia bacterium]
MSSDLDKLQGTWSVTALQSDGKPMSGALLQEARIVVKGDQFTSLGMGAPYKGVLEIAADKKPKTVDLVFTGGHAKGTRQLGIYRIDGDEWSICFALPGDVRPRKFASPNGSGVVLETLSRTKPDKTPIKSPAHQPVLRSGSQSSSGKRTRLEGEWAMVSAVFNGTPMDDTMVKWCKRVVVGNTTKVLAGPQVFLDAQFTLGTGKPHDVIDYVNLSGQNKGEEQAGIYELSGNTLRICVAAPGGPRPKTFASKPGDGRTLTVWQLIKS